MNNFLISADRSALELFVRQSVQITIVALAAGAVATLVRRRRPHLAYALWGLVLIKALTPPVWNSPASLFGWMEAGWGKTATSSDRPLPVAARGLQPKQSNPLEAVVRNDLPLPESGMATQFPMPLGRAESLQWTISDYVLHGWWLGALLTGGLLAATYFSTIRRLRRSAAPVPPRLAALTAEVARRLSLKRVPEVLLTDRCGPAVCGALRPRILLPVSLIGEMSSDQLQTILTHELIHVRRGDLLVAWFQTLAQCVWWFHPLVWWASRAMSRERERCCDLEVISANLCAREDYAQCLVDTLRYRQAARPGLVPVGMTAFEVTRERLEEIMRATAGAWTRQRRAAQAIVLLASLAVLPGGLLVPPAKSNALAESADAAAIKSAFEATVRTMRIQVLGPDDKPLPHARIHSSVWTKEPFKANRDYVCDAQGYATIELPQTIDLMRLWAYQSGHVGLFAQWWPGHQADGGQVPADYTFRLEKGTVMGGVVKNERGEPLDGAKVEVRLQNLEEVDFHAVRLRHDEWLAQGDTPEGRTALKTDAAGRWRIDNVPAGNDIQVSIMLGHPDYISETQWGTLQAEQGLTMQSLRDQSATLVMHTGIVVSGFVIGSDGKKASNALVVWGDDPYQEQGSQEVRTDEKGHYRLPPRPAGPLRVTAVAPGSAPAQKEIDVSSQNSSLSFQLKTGRSLRIRFLDETSKPLANVGVGIIRWRGNQALYNHKHPSFLDSGIPRVSDGKGVFEWTWAPEDPVIYQFYKEGFEYARSVTLEPGTHEVILTPAAKPGKNDGAGKPPPAAEAATALNSPPAEVKLPARTMRVLVLDPDDKPLPKTRIFANVTSTDEKRRIDNRHYLTDAQGRTTLELPKTIELMRLWVNCDGHAGRFAQWWPEHQKDGHLVPAEYTFHLERGTVIGGIVKNEKGEPIPDAMVEVQLQNAGDEQIAVRECHDRWLSEEYPKGGKTAVRTDAKGRWSINNMPAGDQLEVVTLLKHPDYIANPTWGDLQRKQGIAMSALREQSATIVLPRGIALSGFVVDGAKNKVKDAIVVWGDDPYLQWGSQEVRTDEKGHFRLPPLPSGPTRVTAIAPGWAPEQKVLELSADNASHSFQLKPGRTTRVRFVDGAGQPVPGVYVGLERWRDNQALYNHKHSNVLDTGIPRNADEKGLYEWTWAPGDAVVYRFSKAGFSEATAPLEPGEHVVKLSPAVKPKK